MSNCNPKCSVFINTSHKSRSPERLVRQWVKHTKKKPAISVLVFGDQLDPNSAAFDGFDTAEDAVLMMEVEEEATYIPQHKIRLAFFFSAMRHFADDLKDRGYTVYYVKLDDPNNRGSFEAEITRWANKTRPQRLICVRPGDFRVLESVQTAVKSLNCELDMRRIAILSPPLKTSKHLPKAANPFFWKPSTAKCDEIMTS